MSTQMDKLLADLGAPELSDEEVFEHLKYALNTPYAKNALKNLLENKQREAANPEVTMPQEA